MFDKNENIFNVTWISCVLLLPTVKRNQNDYAPKCNNDEQELIDEYVRFKIIIHFSLYNISCVYAKFILILSTKFFDLNWLTWPL